MLSTESRGLGVRGHVWASRGTEIADGVVVVTPDGRIAAVGPATAVALPADLPVLGGPGFWVGPGVVDAHVHLAFAESPAALAERGVVAMRDLGAPPERAAEWRTVRSDRDGPRVAVAGPLLTAPGGYPSRGWGADGFARFVADPDGARAAVAQLAGSVDVVKVAIEPTAGPVPHRSTVAAVVAAAHEHGLPVTAHALRTSSVATAVTAGVDELAHVPLDPLPAALVEEIAAAGTVVVSTLHTHVAGGAGASVRANARSLVDAGVRLVYGTDLGNADTRPGVDPRELRLLADSGLGADGALHAATAAAAAAIGLPDGTGGLTVGARADLVVLPGDPRADDTVWTTPAAVVIAGRVVPRLGSRG